MFKCLKLENFGAFKTANFEFSPNINVFIGENGTGKTHIMKLIYCLQQTSHKEKAVLEQKLLNVFGVKTIGRLVHRKQGTTLSHIQLKSQDKKLDVELAFDNTRSHRFDLSSTLTKNKSEAYIDEVASPVFIPVKEVLSFAPGFISLYDKYDLAFEEIYYDIVKQAYLPARRGSPLKDEKPLLELIKKIVGGKVSIKNDEFQLSVQGSNLEISLVAEGHRKLALIWQLIHNGSLFSNNTLFWDEPEANLNPSLMKEVANILVMLAERNVQVFVATHNYAFLKELEFAQKEMKIAFFALEKHKDEGVIPHKFEQYRHISPNKIADEYTRIYDEEIRRVLNNG